MARLVRPRLTTVANPTAAAGRAAVDMLLQQGDDGATGQVTLRTDLIIRNSTGPGPYAPAVALNAEVAATVKE